MIAQVVFIHRNIQFAIEIKQALERTGNYEVRVFTSGEAAAEALTLQTFQVAVVDFALPEGGDTIVRRLRAVQADLAFIATPRQPADVIQQLGLQGSIAAAFQARDLIPVIHRALEGRRVTRSLRRPPLRPGEISTDPDDYLQKAGGILKTRPSGDDSIASMLGTRPASGRAPDAEYVPLEQIFERGAGTPPAAPPDEPDILIEPDVTEGTPQFRPGISFDDLFHDMDEAVQGHGKASVFPLHPDPVDAELPPPDFPSFDEVLGAIEPASSPRRETDEFDSLVNSMRAQEAPRPPLPSRQQQMVEFTLSSGMDDLLAQIQESRKKTESLADQPPAVDQDVFSKLAQEEPPLPEGEGTISDLVVGVTDPSFQQVMAALRGEEPPPVDAPVAYSSAELREAFSSYYDSYDSHPEALPDRVMEDEVEQLPPRDPLLAEVDDLLASVEAEMRSQPPPASSGEQLDTPARLILELEQMLDPTRPLDTFSISELIDSIERQLPAHRPQVQPLPSWVQELRQAQKQKLERDKRRKGERRAGKAPPLRSDAAEAGQPDRPLPASAAPPAPVNEFDFDTTEFLAGLTPEQMAGEAAVEAAGSRPDSYDLTTMQHDAGALPSVLNDETMALPSQSSQPASLPEGDEIPAEFLTPGAVTHPAAVDWDTDAQPFVPLTEPPLTEEDTSDHTQPLPVEEEEDAAGLLAPSFDQPQSGWQPLVVDDPLIAQISLSLMNVSLESIVEAALLTRNNQIVAFAGSMARDDIETLRRLFHDEWTVPEGGGVKMKFFTLESSGRDYMLYGRRTERDLCLWLIVPGSTHLADIKAQSRKLIEALQSVPETPPEPAAPDQPVEAIEPAVERQPYAYVWTLRDPTARLTPPVAQAILSGMHVQLRERAWQIDDIRAQDDFVYVLAQVPGDTPPYEVIRDLKRRSAEIAREIARRQNQRLDPASLWADSYLIVTPGRPLDMEEIQEYIRFERML